MDKGEVFGSLGPSVCIYFRGLAMLCSAVFLRRMLAIATPRAALIGMYFVNALGKLIEELTLGYRGGLEERSFGDRALCAVSLALLSTLLFGQRDIYT